MTSTTRSSPPDVAPSVPSEVVEVCTGLRRPVVLSHVVPDADALGSMLAVALGLWGDRGGVTVALPDGSVSQRLGFLVEMAGADCARDQDFTEADGFVVLDTARQDRCNVPRECKETDWVQGRPVVNVDHHGTNTGFGTVNWIVETAGSTAELVYALLMAAKRPLTPTIATLLYAGIQTDTLGFSLPATSVATLHAAADLIAAGADVATLGERLCRSLTQSEFDLLRLIYANTRRVGEGRVAYSFADFDDIHGAGCTAADVDDQIGVPRGLAGVQLAMLFTEGIKDKVRINFRSSGAITVVELAREFGGGGHAQAAGAILDGSVEEAVAKVVPRAEEFIKQFA